jgi:TonB family protein
MPSFVEYSIELNLYLLLLFACYNWGIRKSTNFQFNRAFLLSGISLSLLLPLFQIEINNQVTAQVPTIQLQEVLVNSQIGSTTSSFQLTDWILVFYLIGALLSLTRILYGIYKIQKLKQSCRKAEDYYIVPNSSAAFSFFQSIFIGENLSEEQIEVAFKHEKVHLSKLHNLDLMISQFLQTLLFYNPFIYRFKILFNEVHEFEADYYSADKKESYISQLISNQFDIYDSQIIHQFNSTHLKSRIMRIKNRENRRVKPTAIIFSILLFSGLFLLNQNGHAQSEEDVVYKNTSESPKEGDVTVDQMAEYPGGYDAIFNYIAENSKYPADAKKNKISGTVYVEFIVSAEGKISSTKVLRGVENGEALDQEAQRVVKALPKTWTPAKKDGKAVATSTVIPIRFNLSKDTDTPEPPEPPKPPKAPKAPEAPPSPK